MWALAQYTYQSNTSSGVGAVLIIIYLLILVLAITALWKIFTKAGQAGWKSFIPIYNAIIELRIVGMSGWYFLIFLIPFVNIIFGIYVAYKLAVAFGYGIGMTILEFFLVGILILGFGKAKYLGPDGKVQAPHPTQPASPAPPAQPAA